MGLRLGKATPPDSIRGGGVIMGWAIIWDVNNRGY